MRTIIFVLTLILSTECSLLADEVPQSPARIQPLKVGTDAPDITLFTPERIPVSLKNILSEQPTVIIFYRGGWCPYCNRHLQQLQQVETNLIAMGFQIIAISPDRPVKLQKTVDSSALNYRLLSDSSMEAARAFGIAFQVDDATVKKYKDEYKIDIEADSGHTHHQLPVPSIFIADSNGKIMFTHSNPDYKKRMNSDVLIRAVEMLTHNFKK
ncbi:MAG: AhpC/TSA family protein [Kiritimatiellaceae bacterium]|nr:AhpC/TSA family protein [Kiritimatiellaceae bacterium]